MEWAGTGIGASPRLTADNGCDAMVAVVRGFAHQQNRDDVPLAVVIMLAASSGPDLRPLIPKAIDRL